MTDTIITKLAALKDTPTADLRTLWTKLFESEPPKQNRRFLESRLAYRIQELEYGGLKPATIEHLKTLGAGLNGGTVKQRRIRVDQHPIAGTRLIREYQGVEQCAPVTDVGFEYQGRPFKSLSAIARAITGTRWNGWVFFGLRKSGEGR